MGLFTRNTTQETKDNRDKVLSVNKNRCPQNHPCPSIRVCPVKALTQKGYEAPAVNQEKCIKCGKCVSFCPMRAISLS
jgi:Fe-S-cluster-containing hydrogenase component 2